MTARVLPKYFHPDFKVAKRRPSGDVLPDLNPVFAWVGGRDLVSGIRTDESTNGGHRHTAYGRELYFNGTANDQVEWTLSKTGNYTEATVVLVLNPDAPSGNDIVFSTNSDPSSFVGGLSIWTDNNGFETSAANCFSINFENNPGRMETAANSVVAGQFTTLVVEYRQDRVSSCVNGIFKTSMDTGSVPSSIDFSTIRVGGMNHLNDYSGGVLGVVVFDRALSRDLIHKISLDPFRTLFEPREPVFYFKSAGGGATSITPANASISIAGQDVNATTNALPQPDNASVSISGQDVTLSFDIPVTPDSGSISVAGSSVAATTNALPSPGEGSISISGQDLTLTEGVLIAPEVGTLSIAGFAPQLNFTLVPSTASISILGADVSVTESGAVEINPATANLAIAGQDVSAVTQHLLNPAQGTLSIAGESVAIASNVDVFPGTATLSINGVQVDVDAVFAVNDSGIVTVMVRDIVKDLIKPTVN